MPTPLEKMIIGKHLTLRDVINMLDINGIGIVFVVDKLNKICGVITDGDIRRALLNKIGIDDKLTTVMNRSFVAFHIDTPIEKILVKIGYKYKCIPIVNSNGEVVDYYALDYESKIPIAKPYLNGNELKYVTECVATNWISSQGKFINRFEEEFARYIGVKYAVATSNGTTALHLALVALGIKGGDEVIVPSLTFIATANAVSYTGAKPVFVDSEMDTWNMDPKKIESKINDKTKCIIPVHLYGQPAKMDKVMDIAKKHNLFVIEDAAEAHGAEYKDKKVGSIGNAGVFSFYGNKIITTGEGGMVVTDDEDIYQKMRILRDHGMDPGKKYWHNYLGYNYRMTNMQAAIGCAQLERIEDILKKKCDIAGLYKKYLSGTTGVLLPPENNWSKNVFWMYSVVLKNEKERKDLRDTIIDKLALGNIECRPFFYPVDKLPPYYSNDEHEIANYLSGNGINLPSYVGIDESKVKQICDRLNDLINDVCISD